ncbi:MAG: hypothetical protein H0T76_20275 [Nannocystis sp.]|nr:hypothetical protein [Nannocystis sp.]MBA3548826.1 hypothetical protein [Nannocystis sp.]
MAKAAMTTETELVIPALKQATIKLRLIGTTPMIQNRMAAKAAQQLLVGGGKKTAAQRKSIKHDPIAEYRNSAEQMQAGPTALGLRVVAVKAAMCSAALETAGITKTSAQRLIFMPGDLVPLYGVPQLRMDIVRSADMNRTPDVRTRAYLPKWGAEIDIRYIMPQLSASGVATLLCNAGFLIGVGDFRQEKGKGAFGSFRVISADQQDDEWDDLVKNHHRMKQLVALQDPDFANSETAELMDFYHGEVKRRAA